ncbi:hypothetical protein DYBT9623_05295 [Dyadobacter sp. CECT 9623]|uniref:Uncharacterized protein n=1 Tax=Dyadobacter linearis TaxID=2823330 RepID=A0ABN7RIT6_9BACT|nr:hypothetical protein DYBT9623_05295 [Dyadobacter sp. CECT 9623]
MHQYACMHLLKAARRALRLNNKLERSIHAYGQTGKFKPVLTDCSYHFQQVIIITGFIKNGLSANLICRPYFIGVATAAIDDHWDMSALFVYFKVTDDFKSVRIWHLKINANQIRICCITRQNFQHHQTVRKNTYLA